MAEVREINIEDEQYPNILKKYKSAPKKLYYRGTFIKDEEIYLAMVGTRHPSSYGQQVALEIAGQLSEAGITILSGLAPGIDTLCHKAVVEKGKRTIAILGTGLDEKSIYPKENIELSRKIIENGGCLISELPLGTAGSKFSFPKRNRIISGLSKGVIIIEAKEKSGSLITAKYAKEQGKELFALPGPINSLNSKGTNMLIKNGAKMVLGANDILEQFSINNVTNRKEIASDNIEEQMIISQLKEDALAIDKIIEKTKLSPSIVATKLALMEISGIIRNLGGNVYSLNK